MALPYCRLVPSTLAVGTSLVAVPWKVEASERTFNSGFQVVNGSSTVYVPQSGIYRLDVALATASSQLHESIFRLLVQIGGTYMIATGAKGYPSGLTKGPSASGLFRIDVGEGVTVTTSFTGGTAADLHATMSYLSLQLEHPI